MIVIPNDKGVALNVAAVGPVVMALLSRLSHPEENG